MRMPRYIPEYPAPITLTFRRRNVSMGSSFSVNTGVAEPIVCVKQA